MAANDLVELDSLSLIVIIDNELDPISKYSQEGLSTAGDLGYLTMTTPHRPTDRGKGIDVREMRMDQICTSAHGLSIMITGLKDGKEHTMLFDVGPEEEAFERNAKRLNAPLEKVELIHLSHWHRDHSGGMLKAISMINAAKENPDSISQTHPVPKTIVDLHPNRPDFRGITLPMLQMSLEADPSFTDIETAGATIAKNDKTHTVCEDFFLISGEIPRQTEYEVGLRRGARFCKESGQWEKDEDIKDERFVMCKVKDKGLIMFTGCSHAGVVNASRHALELGNGTPLYAVIGGYHLADAEAEQIDASVRDLKALEPKILLPGHCTGWRAKYAIEKVLPGQLAPCTVGTRFNL